MQLEVYKQSEHIPAEFNFEELKALVSSAMEKYKGRVYTAETQSAAKQDRATLNKLIDAIDSFRIAERKKALASVEGVTAQCEELKAVIVPFRNEIDAQDKAITEARKEKKLNDIKEVYKALICDLKGLVPYEKLHNPKWLNVSTSATTVVEELGGKIDRIKAGLDSINSLGLDADIAEQVKGVFLKDFDLAEALAEKERIEKRREELAKYEAAKAAQKVEEEQYTPAEVQEEPTQQVKPAPAEDAEIHTVAFRVWATAGQLEALKSFLKNNNIKYGRA